MANIAWLIHGYPPIQNAGAEWMAKEINDYLVSKGHSLMVFCSQATENYFLDSVYVRGWLDDWSGQKAFDVFLTHLDKTKEAAKIATALSKPLGHIVHHNWEIPELRKPAMRTFCVYNTEWIKQDRKYPVHSIVVNPPVNPERFKDVVVTPKYVTLVNCNEHKGGKILVSLAKAMPDVHFRGVKGFHGEQYISPMPPPNLHYVEGVDDIREVLADTSVLLAPSVYESYGRICIEAAACGIPVVATGTPGIKEAMEIWPAYVNRNDLPGISAEIYSELKQVMSIDWDREKDVMLNYVYRKWEQSKAQLEQLHQTIQLVTSK